MEIVKNTAAILGCLSVAIGLILTVSKTVRHWISASFNKKQCDAGLKVTVNDLCDRLSTYIKSNEEFKKTIFEDMEMQKDFAKEQCRNIIKDIFYRYCDTKVIPLYEFKVATDAFEFYHDKLHANHYITLIYNEMTTWEKDYTHCFEEEE